MFFVTPNGSIMLYVIVSVKRLGCLSIGPRISTLSANRYRVSRVLSSVAYESLDSINDEIVFVDILYYFKATNWP